MATKATQVSDVRQVKVIRARFIEADGDMDAALKLRIVAADAGEPFTATVYDRMGAERKVGDRSYGKFLCEAFDVAKVSDLPKAIVDASADETFDAVQVIYPMKGDNGKVLVDPETDEVIMSNPKWRIELVF